MADPQDKPVPTFEDQAPVMMAQLMREFIAGKSLEARTKLRLRMKALLDFFSADTDYTVPSAAAPAQPTRVSFDESPMGRNFMEQESRRPPIAAAPGMPGNDDLLGG